MEGEMVSFDTDLIGLYGYICDMSRAWICGEEKPKPDQPPIPTGERIDSLQHRPASTGFKLSRICTNGLAASGRIQETPVRCDRSWYGSVGRVPGDQVHF